MPVPIPRPRHRAVLAFLLLNAGRAVTFDAISEALWGGRPPATARAQIHVIVSSLREALGHDTIVTRQSGYLIPDVELDLTEFQRNVADAATAEPEIAVKQLRTALDLWRGEALAGCTAPFAVSAAIYLEEQRLTTVEKLADKELLLGMHDDALVRLTSLLAQHPERGRAAELHMMALYRAGRQAEALTAARQFRAVLAENHGLDPAPSFIGLEQAILRADPALNQPVAAASPTIRVSQLPLSVNDFVGRQDAAAELDVFRHAGACVLAITGAPGMGKTALAVRWAHDHAEAFPDGQLYLNLHGFSATGPTKPAAALAYLLRSLGVQKLPSDVDEASAAFRSAVAGKRLLVVLDNAADADQIRPLLPGSPMCTTLITSRNRLTSLVGAQGARRVILSTLPEADARQLLGRIMGHERLRDEPEATADLLHACAGLPLALRITAAHLADHTNSTMSGYVARLAKDPLETLASHDDEEFAVRTAFDLSYERLGQTEQQLFRQLGQVPAADISTAAAAALMGGTELQAHRALTRLAAAHLVEQHADDRYACHDLLGLYARELASAEHDRTPLDRYLQWYLTRSDAAARALYPRILRLNRPLTTVEFTAEEGLDWLDIERENLLAIISRCAETGPYSAAWLLADDMRGYFTRQQLPEAWTTAATAALKAAQSANDIKGQVMSLLSQGAAGRWSDSTAQSLSRFTTALELSRQISWSEAEGCVLGYIGVTHAQAGDLEAAAAYLVEALELNRRIGNDHDQADDLAALGTIHLDLGRFEEARDYHRASIELFRRLGSTAQESSVLIEYADTLYELGDLAESRTQLELAVSLSRQFGKARSECGGLRSLAKVDLAEGRRDEAIANAQRALTIARDIGHPYQEAMVLVILGSAHGDPALQQLALAKAVEIGTMQVQAEALIALAETHLQLGDLEQARPLRQQALDLAKRNGYRRLEMRAAGLRC